MSNRIKLQRFSEIVRSWRSKPRGLLVKLGPQFPQVSRSLRRLFAFVLIVSSAAGLATGVLTALRVDLSMRAWDPIEVISKSKTRLQGINASLDSARDRLARDPEIRSPLINQHRDQLFPLLADRDSATLNRVSDSLLYSNSGSDLVADHGEALYDAHGHILAWYSSHPGVFGFDTLLSGAALLPTGERDSYLESDPLHAYLNSIRKVVDHGTPIGYVLVKRQLATMEPSTAAQATTFIDDLRDAAHRDVILEFGRRTSDLHSDNEWTRAALFASPDLPGSFVGTISVSDSPARDPSSLQRILGDLWSIGWTLLLIGLLAWWLVGLLRGISGNTPAESRFAISALVLVSLALARLVLVQFGGLEVVAGHRVQDATDFASGWGYGIAESPFELFVSTVFAIVGCALLWIIWAPRYDLLAVTDIGRRRPRRRNLLRVVYAIIAITVAAFLIDALSYVVESAVMNGQFKYLSIKQVWPSQPALMMLLSFLGMGVAYTSLSILLLAFAARAVALMVGETRRRKTLSIIIILTIGALLSAATWLASSIDLGAVDVNYRWAVVALVFAISITIVLIEIIREPLPDNATSLLFRLPRSSRSLLFVLAFSAGILSPLIADWQLKSDEEIAERMVEENANVDAPELQTSLANAISTSADNIVRSFQDSVGTEEVHQAAFLLWLRSLREHPYWNAVIDLYAPDGSSLSHFATAGAMRQSSRLHTVRDSALIIAVQKPGHLMTRVIPCFTGSCTPAVVAAIRLPEAEKDRMLTLTASVWSDLPALAVQRSSFDLLRGSSATNPATEQGFVVAQYRPGMRRISNAPSLDVPAVIPYDVEGLLFSRRAVWHESLIGGTEYQTLYYRSMQSPENRTAFSTVTVSVPEPTVGTKTEFALRLNAIGLLYGTVIALILLLIRQALLRRVYFTLRFRDRIFLIVLLIALVPLVVVTNVTRSLLTQRAQMEEQDRLARDASVIKDRIAAQMESGVVNIFGLDLQSDVEELAQVIGRDFSVFDPGGFLRASTKPELYESSLLAATLSSRAMREVVLGRRSFYSEPLVLNKQRYQVGYQPVMSAQGNKLLAVVSLTTIDEQSNIESEVARTTSFIYGTFAALGLVLLAIGAVFAARVASPIMTLIRATQRVAQGKLKTHIPVDRDDEMGELMHAFNAMTEDLEKSREIVAQNERELAWKEMARQVAHEIKNPLTPMKLSVQHLDHAHEAKDPNFNSIFRRVIRTLGEQIDVLTRIATEFSRFGEMPRRKWGPVSLRQVTESAVALFDAERSRIRFIVDVPKELADVHADEQELRRALVNLIRNAVQAIEGWGVIVIRATQEGGMIHMKLSDTGGGMDKDTLARVFDPNFSTKTSGMGLGLAIVKKTITDMAGTIRVDSKLGHGTTFFIDLPARGYIEDSSLD